MSSELSDGVLAYLQMDIASSPQADVDAVRAVADKDPDDLVKQVVAVVGECASVETDWSTLSLVEAGDAAARVSGEKHPELSPEALKALAWSFTFTWR